MSIRVMSLVFGVATLSACAGIADKDQELDFDGLRDVATDVQFVRVAGCATLTEHETIVLYRDCESARLARVENALDVTLIEGNAPEVAAGRFACLRISGEFRKFGRFITVGYFYGTIGHVMATKVESVTCE